ncbi:dimethylarginine dimethylaminohydrolase family protein [Nocardioides sp.]|uniref:dimethylarginine dimethylaminohydrolase family protein n=1 Tax=Nocardioides sp. TaxID=35761 RepID=UPI0035112A45
MASPHPPYRFTDALTRTPALSAVHGLRADDRGDPSVDGLRAEHAAYRAALEQAGVSVTVLPAAEEFPDSMFVEDPALVFTAGAVVLRPGAPSRLGEAALIAPVLEQHFPRVLALPTGPDDGHVDGGDVLTTAEAVIIGLSARTDRTGAQALVRLLADLGLVGEVAETPAGVLHFKTDCSLLDEETVLSTRRLASSGVFGRFRQVIVPDGEEAAANALRVNDVVLLGAQFPRTADLLATRGYTVVPVPTEQIGLIDAGLSCMSLRWHR